MRFQTAGQSLSSRFSPVAYLAMAAVCLAVVLSHPGAAFGLDRRVAPGGDNLARALAAAAPGDRLLLAAGDHAGGLAIDKAVTLEGLPGSRVLGPGAGHAILVAAPGVVLRGLTITGSGLKLESEDSGIFVTAAATGTVIEASRLEDNLIGIYLKGAAGSLVRGNSIVGRSDLRLNERGNGVQIWNAPGAVVEDNDIRLGRDGIFVTTSKKNTFRRNSFSELRFAIHYMYTNDSLLEGNRSFGNHVGYALMYSRGLKVRDNLSSGDRDHGFLMNYTNRSDITGNEVRGGAKKCVFIYNANKNRIEANRFEGCGIGIHFTAGSERNVLSGNAFVGNRNQVKYVGTRAIEWSLEGQGNYWSDNLAYDLNGDGLGDKAYRPNGVTDQILWRHPLAKLLLNSPALQLLEWAQSAFPTLYPGGVTDSHPLMADPGTRVSPGTRASKERTAS